MDFLTFFQPNIKFCQWSNLHYLYKTTFGTMDLIEKKIRNIVKRVINEERGVNQEVYDTANKIFSIIRDDVNDKMEKNEHRQTFGGDAFCIRGEFSIKLAGEEVLVTYNSYVFQDQETYKKYIRQYRTMLMCATSAYSKGKCQIYVVYNYTNEHGFDESIYDRVQHELEHLYQQIQSGKPFSSSDLKGRVNKGLKMRVQDPNIFKASFILYCSRPYEQDASANGLYSWLQNGTTDKNEIVKSSAIVKNRRICLKYIDELENLQPNSEETQNIAMFFGISLASIIKKGYNSCERMKNKANRTIFKYIQDTQNQVKFVQ